MKRTALGPLAWTYPAALVLTALTVWCWVMFAAISRSMVPACELMAADRGGCCGRWCRGRRRLVRDAHPVSGVLLTGTKPITGNSRLPARAPRLYADFVPGSD